MAGSYKVYVDWDDDGDFSDVGEDVTARTLDGRAPVTAAYGRDQARALSPIRVGEGRWILNNISRDYSPENTSSALYGNVVPGRRVQVTGTYGALSTTVFSGRIDDFTLKLDREERYVEVDCVDALGQLKGVKVSTAVEQGLRTGEAIGRILDAVGWPAADRNLDVGATVMPFWWCDDEDAFDAILALVDSEGPPALISADTAGRVVFRDRHHRYLLSASTTSQATWRSSGVEPTVSSPSDYNHGLKEIVNVVGFQVPIRRLAGDLSQVWSSQGSTLIADGETVAVVAQGSSAFFDAVVPEVDTDYVLASGVVEITLSRTSGASTTISIKATGGPAEVWDLALRAYAVETATTVQVAAEDSSSIAEFGRRSLPDGRVPQWASPGDARAIATLILSQRSAPLSTISVTMIASNTARATEIFNRDLSDRVRMIEDHSGLDADCYVEQISHRIGQGGTEHRATFGLEKVATQIDDVFILGSATDGVLGTNLLGKRGLANSSTMLILGTQATLGTNILTA
jgi:hypothetical protein